MNKIQTLNNCLRKALLEYQYKRPKLSLRAIAKNSGVNRYFLSKLLDDSESSSALDLNQALMLVKYMTKRESLDEAIDESTGQVRDILSEIFHIDLNSSEKKKPLVFQ